MLRFYTYFTSPSKKVAGYRWFLILVCLALSTTLLYLVLHWMANSGKIQVGNQQINFLDQDKITLINQVIDSPLLTGMQSSQDSIKRNSIILYIASNYTQVNAFDKQPLIQLIKKASFQELKTLLPKTPIYQSSYFWLYQDWVYFEIVFWSLFGVIANLFFATSEYLRRYSFEKGEIYVQIAKLIYTPFCAITIFICYHQFSVAGQDPNLESSKYSIAVSFLLGFFSGRMVDLLTRLKDILLPLGKKDETTISNEPQTENTPESVIIEAIEANYDKWAAEYDVESIGAGIKKVAGLLTNVNCIVFKPIDKKELHSLTILKPIPERISFTDSKGEPYEIPTDVQETGGRITTTAYRPPTTLNTCSDTNIKRPGCSISRLKSGTAGTLGIKVYKNDTAYIIGCYHVLCEPELAANITEFNSTETEGTDTVIVPGYLDHGGEHDSIGKIVEGTLDEFLDCALVELSNPLFVNPGLSLLKIIPKKALVVSLKHVNAQYPIQMVGRTSGLQTGTLTSSYCKATIDYLIKGNKQPITIRGLISTTRISDAGDSGAPVIDHIGNLIGIVIATVEYETYILPITRILSQFSVRL
jgi:hypothetical protein